MVLLLQGYVPHFLKSLSGCQTGETLQSLSEKWSFKVEEPDQHKNRTYYSFSPSSGRPNLVRQNWHFTIVLLLSYLMIWCQVCAPSRGNGREKLPLASFAQGFIFAKPWNARRVKNILHCLTCSLLKGSTQYFCFRGNETKYRETQGTLWVTEWSKQAQNYFQNLHK